MAIWRRVKQRATALTEAETGASAVEFAIVLPLFLLLVLGIMVFGLYFGTALSIQQIAANAARAAVAGLDDAERSSLARAEVTGSVAHYLLLRSDRLSLAAAPAANDADLFVVTLTYDASDLPIFGFEELIPTPPPSIVRTSAKPPRRFLAVGQVRFKGILREAHGSTAILAAFVLLIAVWFTAFAADLGSMYYAKREAQAAVDFAAMAAARDPAHADAEARKALAANHIGIIKALVIVPGRYTGDAAVSASRRFTPNATPANAVMITLTTATPLYFGASMLGRDQVEIVVQGVATSTAQAAFSIGSALARLNGGVLNVLLGKLLGTTVSLSVMDYQALLNADVKLFDTLKALSTNAHLGAATYGDVAAAQASVGQILSAAAAVASGSGQTTAASALARLGAVASTSVKAPVGSIVDVGPYGTVRLDNASPGFNPSINLAQLLVASTSVANGAHQVSLDLGASIPGLASVKVDAAIGEPMQNSA